MEKKAVEKKSRIEKPLRIRILLEDQIILKFKVKEQDQGTSIQVSSLQLLPMTLMLMETLELLMLTI